MSDMQKVKIELSYDGAEFSGWQKQNQGQVTVQATLEAALSQIFDQSVSVVGSGRTDAGVHAIGQVAHFLAPKELSRYKLDWALQRLTPMSLTIKKMWLAPDEFHARFSSKRKIYKYYILNSKTPSALKARYVTWIPQPLDMNHLNLTSQHLLGRHDFKSFQNKGSDVSHTVRTLTRVEWRKVRPYLLEFTIEGDGFLKQMVRNIVGTLVDLNIKQASQDELLKILQKKDRSFTKWTAPPQGLYLYKVYYSRVLDNKCRRL